jgi:DNA-directed RNA polymerase beta' subunit
LKKYKDKKVILKDVEVLQQLKHIPNEDVELLGFNPAHMHPKSLVITVLPVIPPRARPYVIAENNITCDDDLTMQYIEIIKLNKVLEDPNLSSNKRENAIQKLKFRIKTLMNNSQGKSKCTTGRAYKGIKERLQGKDGLIRSNLMGKRRNQSARSVISADPTVRTDELVVPEQVANNLTIPEIVAPFNINVFQEMVNMGKVKSVKTKDGNTFFLKQKMFKKGTAIHWGDKIIRKYKILSATMNELQVGDVYYSSETGGYMFISPQNLEKIRMTIKEEDEIVRGSVLDPSTSRDFQLKEGDTILRNGKWIRDIKVGEKIDYKLKVGDVIERHLKNGDIVLFNRQPTLHQASMMAKKIVIRKCKTFRFNLASTKSFNADQ